MPGQRSLISPFTRRQALLGLLLLALLVLAWRLLEGEGEPMRGSPAAARQPAQWPAPFRGRLYVERELRFAGGDGRALAFDLHAPDDYRTIAHPLIIWVHGGGWTQGDKADEFSMAYVSAMAEMGFVVLSINYRLNAPLGRAPFPAATNDVAALVTYLKENMARFNAGARDGAVSIAGHSSGGHLALFQATEKNSALPFACVIALAPITDLRVADFPKALRPYIESFAPDATARALASPVLRIGGLRARSVFVAHARDDFLVPVSQSREWLRQLQALRADVPVSQFFPGAGGHGMETGAVLAELSGFLNRRCRQ